MSLFIGLALASIAAGIIRDRLGIVALVIYLCIVAALLWWKAAAPPRPRAPQRRPGD